MTSPFFAYVGFTALRSSFLDTTYLPPPEPIGGATIFSFLYYLLKSSYLVHTSYFQDPSFL